jgi:hypothetical protein
VAEASRILKAHAAAETRKREEADRRARQEQEARSEALRADVVALWPLDWQIVQREESVSVELVRGLWANVWICPAGYIVQVVTSNNRAFEAVKPALPEAVDALRAGLRDVARRLLDAAGKVPTVVTVDLSKGGAS